MQDIAYTVHTFKESGTYIPYVPELDLSSCGETDDAARKNIRDAAQGFLETSATMGTLDEIPEEAGYQKKDGAWEAPEFVALNRQKVSVR